MILPEQDPYPADPPGPLERPAALEAYLQAAGWALVGYAAARKEHRVAHRGTCAAGLADGLWGHPCTPPPLEDEVLLEAYRTGHRAGSIVRCGNATPPPPPPQPAGA